jgi:hypothetical protein
MEMRRPALLSFLLLAFGARAASADIFTYTDKNGILHFTNVQPPRSKHSNWKVLYATGPGKAMAISGTSTAGCKVSRADVVPARDRSPDRFTRYDAYIAEASRLYAIPEALIRAIIKVESDYDPNVVSCAGAKGLMQVMPYEEKSEHIDHVFDPRENILAGTRMLRTKANHWNGDLVLTIASYHAGVGAVTKYHGVPPYATTQQYVKWVVKQYERYKRLALAHGGDGVLQPLPVQPDATAPTEPVEVGESTSVRPHG